MNLTQKNFENILIFFLVAGCICSPLDSAFGLFFILLAQCAERFFTKNISDSDRSELQTLKSEVEKHADTLRKQGLAKAFSGKQ